MDEGPFFTADHLEELVDRLDALYALYREILQLEPAGSGLLTVAFVPDTCGTGCGLPATRPATSSASTTTVPRSPKT